MLRTLCRLQRGFSLANSFSILGLKPSAKPEEIRKKYYELAKLMHPDVNKIDLESHRKFTEITLAYKNLLANASQTPKMTNSKQDPKSTFYQKTKTEARPNEKRQKVATEHEHYEDFQDHDQYFKKSRKRRKAKTGQDIYVSLTISLKQSLIGSSQKVRFTRKEACSECSDKQCAACFTCGGKGIIYDRANRSQITCPECDGKGYENNCPPCSNSGFILKDVEESVLVAKGTQDKTILRVISNGHQGYRSSNGDLYVTVFVEKSEQFKVDGNNVHSEHQLDYVVATVGGKTKMETLYDMQEVEIPAGTQSGTEFRLFNKGLKSPFSHRMGDQIVKIRIKIPSRLSEKQRLLLARLNLE